VTQHDLKHAPFQGVLERLGSTDATPGGGSAAALAGAMGASLVRMLAGLTKAHEDFADRAKLLEAVADQAEETRDHLLAYAEKDGEVFEAVLTAQRLAQGTEEERAARRAAIQEALKAATEVPLRVMEECLQVIGLAKNVLESGLHPAASDGAVGAVLARAGLQSASLTVKANLALLDDHDYAQISRTKLDEMLYMGTKVCTALDSYVNDLWKK
jgi:formiminotetrahydrofolate cyclodeaminase